MWRHASLLLLSAGLSAAAFAADTIVNPVAPRLQTRVLTAEDHKADADDPAVWVNPADPAASLIVTAVKNGGMRVYSLGAALLQTLDPMQKGARINNVDIVYDVPLADGTKADLVIASDRGLDIIRIFRIAPGTDTPLTEITDLTATRAFPSRRTQDGTATEENPLDDQNTVYGLAAYKDAATGKVWVAGTQRHQPVVGFFTLEPRPDGKMAAVFDHAFSVATEHKGQSLLQEDESDPRKDWSPQFEGVVFDRTDGRLYAGQEDVGLWRIAALDKAASPELLYETRGSSESPFNNPASLIARDVEGLTIYYGDGVKYLLASSQGSAHGKNPSADAPFDDSFVVFAMNGGLSPLGSFRVVAEGAIDAVQESDGADVTSFGLPGFESGLFITQDGYAGDLNALDGKEPATNFKFVDWRAIAESFTPPLAITPSAFDPRH